MIAVMSVSVTGEHGIVAGSPSGACVRNEGSGGRVQHGGAGTKAWKAGSQCVGFIRYGVFSAELQWCAAASNPPPCRSTQPHVLCARRCRSSLANILLIRGQRGKATASQVTQLCIARWGARSNGYACHERVRGYTRYTARFHLRQA